MWTRMFCLASVLWSTGPVIAEARTWKSAVGGYEIEADAIAVNDHMVILKKASGDLVAVELTELSQEDQAYAKSKELGEALSDSLSELQTWTSADGLKVRGRVLAFGRKELSISRQRGKVFIGETVFAKLDPLHQRLVLKIVSHLEGRPFPSDRELLDWAKTLGGKPKVYPLEGVLMQLESGDEIGVPFFLFSSADLQVLQPGWKAWLEAEENESARNRESLMMQAEATQYQQNQMQYQQIEMLKLNLMAVATGLTSVWEVGLVPGQGVYGRPTTAIVTARDSLTAAQMANAQYPGFVVGFVRRVSY